MVTAQRLFIAILFDDVASLGDGFIILSGDTASTFSFASEEPFSLRLYLSSHDHETSGMIEDSTDLDPLIHCHYLTRSCITRRWVHHLRRRAPASIFSFSIWEEPFSLRLYLSRNDHEISEHDSSAVSPTLF